MRIRLSLAAAGLVGVCAAAPAYGAKPNVCRLVPAKQASALAGAGASCVAASPLPGPGSRIFTANWNGKGHLQVSIAVYSDAGALAMARRNLNQGLAGTPRKVRGIGTGAYESAGAGSFDLRFAAGKDVVTIVLTPGSDRSARAVEALAKAVAARL